jgi:hypothetical protein
MKALAWAGIMMLFNFSTWKGGLLEPYYNWLLKLNNKISKFFGLCIVCTGFWWGIIVWYLWDKGDWFEFVGISEGILILYSILLIKWFK